MFTPHTHRGLSVCGCFWLWGETCCAYLPDNNGPSVCLTVWLKQLILRLFPLPFIRGLLLLGTSGIPHVRKWHNGCESCFDLKMFCLVFSKTFETSLVFKMLKYNTYFQWHYRCDNFSRLYAALHLWKSFRIGLRQSYNSLWCHTTM